MWVCVWIYELAVVVFFTYQKSSCLLLHNTFDFMHGFKCSVRFNLRIHDIIEWCIHWKLCTVHLTCAFPLTFIVVAFFLLSLYLFSCKRIQSQTVHHYTKILWNPFYLILRLLKLEISQFIFRSSVSNWLIFSENHFKHCALVGTKSIHRKIKWNIQAPMTEPLFHLNFFTNLFWFISFFFSKKWKKNRSSSPLQFNWIETIRFFISPFSLSPFGLMAWSVDVKTYHVDC